MNPKQFFDNVANHNAQLAIKNPADLRLSVNAIMTLDAFFGILHAALYKKGVVREEQDDNWKDHLADEDTDFRLVRDTASALKHGELTRKKPRLIRRADKVATQPGAFSGGFNPAFNVGAVQPSPRRCKSKPPPTTPRMHW